MRHYIGTPLAGGGVYLREDNSPELKPLNPRLDLPNHSPDGLAWGYDGGSGPAQLALALLTDATGAPHLALTIYQVYKQAVISSLPFYDGWEMTRDDVRAWVFAHLNRMAGE